MRFYFAELITISLLLGWTMPLDANREKQVLDLVQTNLKLAAPITVELLSGGLSGSEIFKVDSFDKAYVVRFWNMLWEEDFPQDLACQKVASDAGYGPTIYFTDELVGVTVMEYHLPEPLPTIPKRLRALVDLLKKVHGGPEVPKGIERTSYLDQLIDEIQETELFDLEAIRGIKDTVYSATYSSAECVPCHRDLHHGNLIYTQGSFLAIDYTWGAMDDPYVDLATIAIFNCETLEEELILLQLYLGRVPEPKEIRKLSLMKVSAKIFYGLEFLRIALAGGASGLLLRETKNYKNFGRHGGAVPSTADFLNYATSLFSEVFDYAQSDLYYELLR